MAWRQSGLAVGRVTARAHKPLPNELTGIVVRLDGDAPQDRTPPSDPATDPLSQGAQNYNLYTLEVVQRIGYDSFTPTSGVLITKNKDQASPVGRTERFNVFNWVIDANPQDIQVVDFKRPNGEPVMRTIADYRQLNDAMFHAGLNSGSDSSGWTRRTACTSTSWTCITRRTGLLSYTLGARSLDGAGPQSVGSRSRRRRRAVAAPRLGSGQAGASSTASFTLRNTGRAAPIPDGCTRKPSVRRQPPTSTGCPWPSRATVGRPRYRTPSPPCRSALRRIPSSCDATREAPTARP